MPKYFFYLKSLLGNVYRHLGNFYWSHWLAPNCSHIPNVIQVSFSPAWTVYHIFILFKHFSAVIEISKAVLSLDTSELWISMKVYDSSYMLIQFVECLCNTLGSNRHQVTHVFYLINIESSKLTVNEKWKLIVSDDSFCFLNSHRAYDLYDGLKNPGNNLQKQKNSIEFILNLIS